MTEPTQTAGQGDGSTAPGEPTAARKRPGRMPGGLPERRPPDGVTAGRCGLGELLGIAGGELAARGLAVTEVRYNGELVEIDVTNPGDPDRGKANIGRDGYLIWERWGPSDGGASAGSIVNIVAGLLAGEPVEQPGRDDR
jgi:hypothetical protein